MTTEIIITNVRTNTDGSQYGFAVTTQGEGVFIPVSIATMLTKKLNTGDRLPAILQPNAGDKSNRTPWFCTYIKIDITDEVQNTDPAHVTSSTVLSQVNESEYALTAGDVAHALKVEKTWASSTLSNLHRAGEISRISLYRSHNSMKASITAYVGNNQAMKAFENVLEFEQEC